MLIIIGDSHTIALRNALGKLEKTQIDQAKYEFGGIEIAQLDHGYKFLTRFYKERPDGLGVGFSDARALEIFSVLTKDAPPNQILRNDSRMFVICAGFHPSGSMLPKHWKSHTCSMDVGNKMYISKSAFQEYVKDYTKETVRFYTLLRDLNVNFKVLACPPLPASYYQGEVAEVFSKSELLTYYNRFRDCFAKILDENGISYILPPSGILDADGFMRSEFASDNKVGDYHANSAYGAVVLKELFNNLSPLVQTNVTATEPKAKVELRKACFKNGRFYPEGISIILGKHCADYKDIQLRLILESAENRLELPLAKTHKSELTAEMYSQEGAPIIYDKGWFCTYQHEGLDLSLIADGEYKLAVTLKVGDTELTADVQCLQNCACTEIHRGLSLELMVSEQRVVLKKNTITQPLVSDAQKFDNKVRIAVLGSCLSADVQNPKIISNFKNYFVRSHALFQSSMISMMASPLSIPSSEFEPLSGNYLKDCQRDVSKPFLMELAESPPDFIIMDLFCDARFAVFKYQGSFITNNEWKIGRTNFWSRIKNNVELISMKDTQSEYLRLFTDAVLRFKSFFDDKLPDTKLILNTSKGVHSYLDADGACKLFNTELVNRINTGWLKLDDIVLNILDPIVINTANENQQSSHHHPGGVGYVHYSLDYYERMFHELIKIANGK